METIFTLIIVLLPVIFKLIGKKLEQSGAQPQEADEQQPIEDWAEVLRRHIDAQQPQEEARPAAPVQQPVQPVHPVQQQRPQPKPAQKRVVEEGVSQTRQQTRTAPKKAKPILQEEEQKTTEKIDKKKLILYSEIMKPKYNE